MGTGPRTGPGGGAESVGDGGAVEATGEAELEGADAGDAESEGAGDDGEGEGDAAGTHEAASRRSSSGRMGHRPWKRGLRFSAKAVSASRRSSLTRVRS
jgi:hypothetical protein